MVVPSWATWTCLLFVTLTRILPNLRFTCSGFSRLGVVGAVIDFTLWQVTHCFGVVSTGKFLSI